MEGINWKPLNPILCTSPCRNTNLPPFLTASLESQSGDTPSCWEQPKLQGEGRERGLHNALQQKPIVPRP